jgi:hypothetical protein
VAGVKEQIQFSAEEQNPGKVIFKVSEAFGRGLNGLDTTLEPLPRGPL